MITQCSLESGCLHLPSQQVEVLGRRRRVDHIHVDVIAVYVALTAIGALSNDYMNNVQIH